VLNIARHHVPWIISGTIECQKRFVLFLVC
jgi:hypothetical protein